MKKFLIVVDMQTDFVSGALGTKEAEAIVPAVVNKIRTFDGTVLATLDTHGTDYLATAEGRQLPVIHCVKDTAGWGIEPRVAEALKEKSAMLVEKPTFGSTELPKIIKKLAGRADFSMELIGLCTDICVVSNALMLKAHFPEKAITVDASCCAGVTPQTHEAALTTMACCQIGIINQEKDRKKDMFDAVKVKDECVAWIRRFFEENGPGCNAVVGISGGKDSSIVAALCVEALGKDRVIGVLMPCGVQHDIDMAELLVHHLDIKHYVINIQDAVEGLKKQMPFELSFQSVSNIPPRVRMTTLYAVSQSHNGRVANTCNLSEDWVGYSTRYGDSVGDFSPCSNLTVAEMKQIGRVLGLPDVLVDKTPIDGLCGKTDEDNLGFTYAELDRYIRTGEIEDQEKKANIDRRHKNNLFKLQLMPVFRPSFMDEK